jgi:hypothetical protein
LKKTTLVWKVGVLEHKSYEMLTDPPDGRYKRGPAVPRTVRMKGPDTWVKFQIDDVSENIMVI